MRKKNFVRGMVLALALALFGVPSLSFASEPTGGGGEEQGSGSVSGNDGLDTATGGQKDPAVQVSSVTQDDTALQDGNTEADAQAADAADGQSAENTYLPYEGAKYSLKYTVEDGGITITGAVYEEADKDNLGQLVIPAAIDGVDVRAIGASAFKECKGFTGKLEIPDGIAEIEERAFNECTNMSEVVIPSSVERIGDSAFDNCGTKITVLGSATTIGSNAFWGNLFVYGYSGSTAEAYAKKFSSLLFVPIDESDVAEYRVSTSEELLNSIGSYRKIVLADGIYEVSDSVHIYKQACLTIEAEHPGRAEILLSRGDVPVVVISGSAKVNIIGCILGHVAAEYAPCSEGGEVIYPSASRDISIKKCDLYGCGLNGFYGNYRVENVCLEQCLIRDCTSRIIYLRSEIPGLNLKNCIMSGNGQNWLYHGPQSAAIALSRADQSVGKISFEDCTFLNNGTDHLLYNVEADFVQCGFYNNVWDSETPQANGICLNGITWQVEGDVLKIGYPLQLDEDTTIQSATGAVLNYSDYSLPWKKYTDLVVDVAPGVYYGRGTDGKCVVNGAVLKLEDMTGETIFQLLNKEGNVAAETVIDENSAAYTLENVSSGAYTLRVRKTNYVTRDYPIRVNLSDNSVIQDIELHHPGDVTGDGKVNAADKLNIYKCIEGGSSLDGYGFLVGDVTNDGKINMADKLGIYKHIEGSALLWK